MMKKLLALIFWGTFALTNNQINAQSISQINIPAGPVLSCSGATITVNATQLCINYSYQAPTQSIIGNTLLLNLNWASAGPICLGALAFIQEPFTFTSLPPGVNTVEVRTYLDGVQQNFSSTTMNVASCCPATPSFTQNLTAACVSNQDTFNFTNTSTGSIGQNWFVNDIIQSTGTDFSYYQDIPGGYMIKLVVTDGTCSDSSELMVNVFAKPTPNLGVDIESCFNESEVLSVAAGYPDYDWSFFANNSPSIIVSSSNTYYVEVTDVNGCKGSDTINVNFNPLPIVDLGNDTTLCSGQSLNLNAGDYSIFDWSTGESSQIVNVDVADTFSVTVEDINGCEGSGEIVITTAANPILDLGPDLVSICDGDSVSFDAGIHSSYNWSSNESSQSITAFTEGLYSVVVTNSDNCEATDGLLLEVYDLPVINWPGSLALCADTSITLDAGVFASYVWSDNSTDQTLTLDANTLSIGDNTITLSVADSNTCSTIASLILTLVDCDTIQTGIKDNALDPNLIYYPNPCNDLLNIEFSSLKQNIQLSVFDLNGSAQLEKHYENTLFIQASINNLSPGIYIVQLTSANKHTYLKIVKK